MAGKNLKVARVANETSVPEGVVIDRGRVSHGEATDMTFAGARIEKLNQDLAAGRDVDFDELRRLVDSVDAHIAKVVVSVPEDWFLGGVKFGDEHWIKGLSQPRYEQLVALARRQEPGDPKA